MSSFSLGVVKAIRRFLESGDQVMMASSRLCLSVLAATRVGVRLRLRIELSMSMTYKPFLVGSSELLVT